MHPEAIPTNPSAVFRVAKPGSQSVTKTVAMGPDARCSLQYVVSVARIPKYPLNHVVTDQFTAVIATEKPDPVDKKG